MKEHRKAKRFNAKCYVNLVINDQVYQKRFIKNISTNGMLIEGNFDCKLNSQVQLEILVIDRDYEINLKLPAKVSRKDDNHLGLKFINISDDDYDLLQTIILYCSINPYETASNLSK